MAWFKNICRTSASWPIEHPESWSGAMAAWNLVTTNGGTYPQGYDDEDRFVHFAQAGQSKTFNFTRSDIGNITNVNLNGTGTARGFNNIHALTSIGSATQVFNSDGNLTTSQAGHTNTWDEAAMMKQSVVPAGSSLGVAGTNEYGYDADRKRVWKKITPPSGSPIKHRVFIHAGPNLIAEYDIGTAAASPTQEYVYAQEIDSLVMLVRNSGNQKLTITRNQQWSVTALSDSANGSVLERYTYDHFGKRTILEPNGTTVRATSSYNMPFGYTSREHDVETGLMYFRARYYDPHTAEFTSTDPLEYVDGMSLFRGYFLLVEVDPEGTVSFRICKERIDAIKRSAKWKQMRDKFPRCKEPDIECTNNPKFCSDKTFGGAFNPNTKKIVICYQNIPRNGFVTQLMLHEIVHHYDDCVMKTWTCENRACSEVRAYGFANCRPGTKELADYGGDFKKCVRGYAALSTGNDPDCRPPEPFVDAVFDKCFCKKRDVLLEWPLPLPPDPIDQFWGGIWPLLPWPFS